ncbi:hypothetical protein [Teredinibacter turnerae]|uniref:Lipoprotein n=1 Tax=Teredinibacter turnerae (strain ATCC 39867 / T7901) TaxID=377629 RepID=C5BRG9_TERTT|nr:hypothetical protein [Teredinibacter turnerae]ACR11709.1 hypothetical protein TERTU_3550 [Teredinibacter turnerae T7901]
MRVLLALTMLIAVQAQSANATEQEIASARVTVEEYRELRRQCSDSIGDERKACFRELNAATESYQVAKGLLATSHTHDSNNLHLVSYVDY